MPTQLVSDEDYYWSVVEELLEALWVTNRPTSFPDDVEAVWWVSGQFGEWEEASHA